MRTLSLLEGDEWSASCPCCFIPEEKAFGTHSVTYARLAPELVWHSSKEKHFLAFATNLNPVKQPID
jgi:hypothetical protein